MSVQGSCSDLAATTQPGMLRSAKLPGIHCGSLDPTPIETHPRERTKSLAKLYVRTSSAVLTHAILGFGRSANAPL